MLHWAFDLHRIRIARKAAVATIAPMVETSRQRLGGIPRVSWSDPYVIGFMIMLITIVAKVASAKLDGDALCTVQAKAWEDITQRKFDAIGEDVLLLSYARDLDFDLGCNDAISFASILASSQLRSVGIAGLAEQLDPLDLEAIREREDILAAWALVFDAHISARNASEVQKRYDGPAK